MTKPHQPAPKRQTCPGNGRMPDCLNRQKPSSAASWPLYSVLFDPWQLLNKPRHRRIVHPRVLSIASLPTNHAGRTLLRKPTCPKRVADTTPLLHILRPCHPSRRFSVSKLCVNCKSSAVPSLSHHRRRISSRGATRTPTKAAQMLDSPSATRLAGSWLLDLLAVNIC